MFHKAYQGRMPFPYIDTSLYQGDGTTGTGSTPTEIWSRLSDYFCPCSATKSRAEAAGPRPPLNKMSAMYVNQGSMSPCLAARPDQAQPFHNTVSQRELAGKHSQLLSSKGPLKLG
jgi:hypothetical protein